MNAAVRSSHPDEMPLDQGIAAACARVAPAWPLDRLIAVNPHWGRIDRPFDAAGADLARQSGGSLWMPAEFYRNAWRAGLVAAEDLGQAARDAGDDSSVAELVAALDRPRTPAATRPLPSDCVDATRDLVHEPSWRDAITHQVSQYCAAHFDRDQAEWRNESRQGLYHGWHAAIVNDRGVALLMHAPAIRGRAHGLPADPRACIALALDRFSVPPADVAEFLTVALARIAGWASWCAYLRWQAQLAGGSDDRIVELLAIRLGWECLLDDGARDPGSAWHQWQDRWRRADATIEAAADRTLAIWQHALELAYQRPLAANLSRSLEPGAAEPVAVQAVFCIDVRSEVFRRALERVSPSVQTLGFAGFFGLPIEYSPLGTPAARPQLPGLLAPMLTASDSTGDPARDRMLAAVRTSRLGSRRAWQSFERVPGASFTLIETLGLGYVARIVRRIVVSTRMAADPDRLGLSARESASLRPRLVVDGPDAGEQRVQLAARILRAMNLTQDFARTVLLAGHGSQSANNPQAAGLDCGACCGQTGAVNARALADLLNQPAVRQGLAAQGIAIPATTHFLPALHNTTTDDVELFDVAQLPKSHATDLVRLRAMLAAAGERARAERAPTLGLDQAAASIDALGKAIRARANDWAEVRPEWGLANNASFIAAPRSRTRGLDLQGRAFLHEYDWRTDTDGSVLELIMTAPMIVAHWINLQYYASTVDNRRYGSGNKLLHNVVGGRIGVFEGNGGDLRIGLSMQSLHDGERWRHTPLRLSVCIEAPRSAIEAVIGRHAVVRQLVAHRWLHLLRLGERRVESYAAGHWHEVARDGSPAAGAP